MLNVGRSREDVAEVCGSLTVDKGGGGVVGVGVEPETVPGAVGVGRDAGEEEVNALVTWYSMRDCDGSYGREGVLESLERDGGRVGSKVV